MGERSVADLGTVTIWRNAHSTSWLKSWLSQT